MQRNNVVVRLALVTLLVALCTIVEAKPASVPSDEALVRQSVAVLQKGVQQGRLFVKVHAAEALIWNGYTDGLYDYFVAQDPIAGTGYRIGVWRTLAQLEWKNGPVRDYYVQKIRDAYLDPASKDRPTAVETLGKLKDTSLKQQLIKDSNSSDPSLRSLARWAAANSGSAKNEKLLSDLLRSNNKMFVDNAAYAFRFFKTIHPSTFTALKSAFTQKPEHGGVYVASAMYVHGSGSLKLQAQKALWQYLKTGNTEKKFEAGLGLSYGMDRANIPYLLPVMQSDKDLDARIAAAQSILRTIKKPRGWGYKDELRRIW